MPRGASQCTKFALNGGGHAKDAPVLRIWNSSRLVDPSAHGRTRLLRLDAVANMTLKERIEQNVVIWLLGTLLAGFSSGFAAYRVIQEIGGWEPISKWELKKLQEAAATAADTAHANVSDLERKLTAAEAEQNSLTDQLQSVTAERDRLRAEKDAPIPGPAPTPTTRTPSPCFGLTNVKLFAPTSPLTEELAKSLQSIGCTVQRQSSAQFKQTITVFYPEDVDAAQRLRTHVESVLPLTVEEKDPIRGEGKGKVLIGRPGPG